MIRTLQRLDSSLNRCCRGLAVTFLLLMLAAVLLQVIARYVFFAPPPWTEELARYCMVWAGLLGATVAFHERQDPVLAVGVRLRGRGQRIAAELLQSAAVLVVLGPVLVFSPAILRHHMLRITEGLGLPSAYVMLILPLFSAIILFHALVRLLALVAERAPETRPE